MDLISRCLTYTKLYWHALFFGLKAVDDIIRVNSNISRFEVGTEHCIQITNIWAELLRGELTEQVKQLRYTIYKVNEEADRYKYIGNGVCVKKEAKTRNKPVIVQEQREDTQNYTWALGEIKGVDQQSLKNFIGIKSKKLIQIEYHNFPTLQFNDNIEKIRIDKKKKTATLYMSMDVGYTPKSKRLSKYLEDSLSAYNTLTDINTKLHFLYKNELCGNIESISFKTYKCSGEYDDNIYKLENVYPVAMRRCADNQHTLEIDIRFNNLKIDVFTIDKVFNKEQQEKYDRKEKKAETCIEYADALSLLYREDEIDIDAYRNLNVQEIRLDAFK